MHGPDWLTARPVAHRGLHDAVAGIVENTPSAFTAAVAANYAIECDIRISVDGEAMVYHDDTLGRLTDGGGRLDAMTAETLKRVSFRTTSDRMLTLGELCDLVAGRVAIFIELKSRFDGDGRLAVRAAEVLARYQGPAALMSFDPVPIAALRTLCPQRPRGVVAEAKYDHSEWRSLSGRTKRALSYFLHAMRSRPQFVAYSVKDLPAAVPWMARSVFRLPLLTWTVRTSDERDRATRHADQMIFEGFRP
jgi:glycerophosphoryl diester phosphodiesterase